MKRLLKLYPAVWRGRYEAEVADLLDELPADRRIAIDLFRGAVTERGRAFWRRLPEAPVAAGGPPLYFGPVHRHPTALAVIALLLVAPTSTFVLLSFAAYELGVSGLQAIARAGAPGAHGVPLGRPVPPHRSLPRASSWPWLR